MENVLLGNIPVTVETGFSPQNSGGYVVSTPAGGSSVSLGPGQPNPDGTYTIHIPDQDKPTDGAVVAKETDEPTGEGGNNEGEGNGEGADVKKYLPFIMAGAALLFLFYMKRKK